MFSVTVPPRMGVGVGEATLGLRAVSASTTISEKSNGAIIVCIGGIFIGAGLANIVGAP